MHDIPILIAFAICLLVLTWFVTWGDWRLFDAERFGGYYDAQARAILHGRFDVPPDAIGFEAFVRDGKSYGYFGIAPALLRIPLLILFPGMDGHWSRVFTLIGCMLGILYGWRLLGLVRGGFTKIAEDPWLESLFILSAGIGSTTVVLASRSYTYHEAILWGSTFSILFAYYLARYLQRPTLALLLIAGGCCFLSFLSRATAGAGVLLAFSFFSVYLFHQRIRKVHAFAAATMVVLTVAVYLGINYAKFRTFEGVPVRYYSLYLKDPHRMQVTGGRQIHLSNLRTNALAYLGAGSLEIGREFPWVYMSTQPRVFPEAVIDVVEPHSSIPVSMPAMLLLAIIGCRAIASGSSGVLRSLRLPAAGLLVGGSVIFVTVGITERYLHDLYPFLMVAGAAGAARLSIGKQVGLKTAALAPLVLLGVLLNVSFAYDFQREIVWGVPQAKRDELSAIRSSIDRRMHCPPLVKEEP